MVAEATETEKQTETPGEGEETEVEKASKTSAQPEAKVGEELEALKARNAELESRYAEIERERNDLRGQRIGQLKETDRHNELVSLMDSLAETITSGDTALYKKRRDELEEAHKEVVAAGSWETDVNEAVAELNEIAEDAGLTLPEMDKMPAFKSAGLNWKNAYGQKDSASLRQAVREAKRAAKPLIAERTKKLVKEAEVKGREEALKETGAFSQSRGKDGGGGGGVNWQQAQKIKKVEDISDEAYLKAVAGQ